MTENYRSLYGMCVAAGSPQYSGFNNYLHGRKLFDADYDLVVNPNNDTLYSTTFADLRAEPVVISVPPAGGTSLSSWLTWVPRACSRPGG